MSWLERHARAVETPLRYAAAAIVAFMMLSVMYDIVARQVFSAPTLWINELAEYSLVYLTFLPAAGILLRDGHVKLELLMMALGPRRRAALGFVADVLGVVYCVLLAWYSATFTYDAFERDFRFSTAWAPLQSPIYVIIPIGSALLVLAYAVRLLLRTRGEFRETELVARD